MMKFYALLLTFFLNVQLYSQNVNFDKTYGENGVSLHQFGSSDDITSDFIQLSNGKILISGTFGLVRLNSDYSLDTSFGKKGRVKVPLNKIYLQSDGKVVGIGADAKSSVKGITIYRFLSNGDIDATYAYKGKLDLPNAYWLGSSTLQGDKLLISYSDSYSSIYEGRNGKVIRISLNGELDTSFGKEGVLDVVFPDSILTGIPNLNKINLELSSIFVRPDGQILLGGKADFIVIKNEQVSWEIKTFISGYTSEGILNTDFGTKEGFRIIREGPSDTPEILLCADGTIVMFNRAIDGNRFKTFFTKITSDGREVIIEKDLGYELYNEEFRQIKELSNGEILISGSTMKYKSVPSWGILVMLTPNGNYDDRFGENGYVKINERSFTTMRDRENAVGVIEDKEGNLQVIGTRISYLPQTGYDIALYKFDKNGKQFLDFGDGGILAYDFPNNEQTIRSAVIQPDNNLLFWPNLSTIKRMNSNGILDTSFEFSDGKSLLFVNDIDGSFIVESRVSTGLSRYDKNGKFLHSLLSNNIGSVNEIVEQPDGKYISIRTYNYNRETHYYIDRNNPDGSIDESFAPFYRYMRQRMYSLASQPDGKLLIRGEFDENGAPLFEPIKLIRLNVDGSVDESFKADKSIQYANGEEEGYHDNIILQSDGKIILYNKKRIYRLFPDGSLDTTYGNNGELIINSLGYHNCVLQSDDKLLLNTKNASGTNELIRLNADGTLDTTFADQGKFVFDSSYDLNYVILQSDNKIVMTGSRNEDGEQYVAIVRLKIEDTQIAINTDKEKAQKGEAITFSFESAIAPTSYLWEIEDGTELITSTEANPVVRFKVSGEHKVLLKVTYPDGTSALAEKYITIENSTLGINENNLEEVSIDIAPNPTTGLFKIVSKGISEKLQLQIIDVNGRVLVIQELSQGLEKSIDVQHLPAGIYMVKIQAGDQTIVKKLIKK